LVIVVPLTGRSFVLSAGRAGDCLWTGQLQKDCEEQGMATITLEKQGHVGIMRLNRSEKFNAITPEMQADLEELTIQIEGDPSIRCILLAGEGKHFCAGIDINHLAGAKREGNLGAGAVLHARVMRFSNLVQPIVVAIHGACMGAGLELALSGDIRIGAKSAVFSMPEVSFGVSPDIGGSQRLPRLIGPSQTKRLLLGCEKIDAEEALRIGVIDELVETEELETRALALAERIASQPPVAVCFAKKAVNLAMESSLAAGLLYEQTQAVYTLNSEDKTEATAAFLEKRKPVFKGR
jgi:enoyl-CoA hydratase